MFKWILALFIIITTSPLLAQTCTSPYWNMPPKVDPTNCAASVPPGNYQIENYETYCLFYNPDTSQCNAYDSQSGKFVPCFCGAPNCCGNPGCCAQGTFCQQEGYCKTSSKFHKSRSK